MLKAISTFCVCYALTSIAFSQQLPQYEYEPPPFSPTFHTETGPRIVIDGAHHNFHTVDGGYRAFAKLLSKDGFRVQGNQQRFSAQMLNELEVLVIVNALNERNLRDWSLPTPSAFEPDEIEAVRQWVACGGSLLLIADHMPFPGAAADLASVFGVKFSNGYARPAHRIQGQTDTFGFETGLERSFLTSDRPVSEQVTSVATFGGSAFVPPMGALSIINFGRGAVCQETTRAPGITDDAKSVSVEGWCQGAIFCYGRGRVAVFGEAAMFSAQTFGEQQRPMGMNAEAASQNHQLALNVMRWLSRVN